MSAVKLQYNIDSRAPKPAIYFGGKSMLKTKQCTQCNTIKSTSEYGSHSQKIDGLNSWCKPCSRLKSIERSKTPNGLVTKIYTSQRQKSKRRNHPMPIYTKDELFLFITSHKDFSFLFNQWVESGYNTEYVPSIDRLNDYLPYSICNINLTTWKLNNARGHQDRRSGVNNKHSKAVLQYTLDGIFINEFHSLNEACRITGSDVGHIGKCCKGVYRQSNGFIWKYKEIENGNNS